MYYIPPIPNLNMMGSSRDAFTQQDPLVRLPRSMMNTRQPAGPSTSSYYLTGTRPSSAYSLLPSTTAKTLQAAAHPNSSSSSSSQYRATTYSSVSLVNHANPNLHQRRPAAANSALKSWTEYQYS